MKIDRVQTVFIVIGYFVGFEKYGIDVFYNRKYQKWLAENSTDAESLNSDNDKFVPEFDEVGFITNITFTPFENGIPLTESVYIEEQKKYLDGILKLTDLTKSEKRKIEYFINYLNDRKQNLKVGAVPQQFENIKPDEVYKKLHNNIFVDSSFEIWQKMFDDFKIDASKRTDLDFMFAIMKYNNLIHENIGFINMQNWINKKYQIAIEKLKYTNIKAKANEKRMTVYNLITSKQ